jgi:hypothetical protein
VSLAWLAPAALIGIGLIVLPIAIHLLVRQHVRTLPYPSLRFLLETQLAAFRRRSIQDAWLLLCRAAIVTAAAMALAGPVLETASRRAARAERISRAIIGVNGADRDTMTAATEGAFASSFFFRPSLADALADASRWLDSQPPSSREIVIIGALRRGMVTEADLSAVKPEIGIRFQPVTAASSTNVVLPVLTWRDDALVRVERHVRISVDATAVTDGASAAVSNELVSISAAPADQPLADAALRAALDAGIPWTNFNQRVVIVWDGAGNPARAQNAVTTRVIPMAVPSPPASAADAVREALLTASPPRLIEPVLISAEQLAAWTRSPGPPSAAAPLADEGDRRWLWGIVLALLAIEAWLRRSTDAAAHAASTEEHEVRIA